MSDKGPASNPWKWIAIAALVILIGGPCVCFGGVTLLSGAAISGAVGMFEPMLKSTMTVASTPELVELLGEPIEFEKKPTGEITSGEGGQDSVADFTYEVSGSRSKGLITVKGTRPGGEGDWVYETMVLDIERDGAPSTYDLITNTWR